MKTEDNVLTAYPLTNGKHFTGLLSENREHYLGDQETELEDMNEREMDKINLDIEIVKMTTCS
jgi:hypothetical protein